MDKEKIRHNLCMAIKDFRKKQGEITLENGKEILPPKNTERVNIDPDSIEQFIEYINYSFHATRPIISGQIKDAFIWNDLEHNSSKSVNLSFMMNANDYSYNNNVNNECEFTIKKIQLSVDYHYC